MRIIAAGDIHMAPGKMADVPNIGAADYIIVIGDITNYGSIDDAATVLSALRRFNSSLLAVAGNLDQRDVARFLEESGISLHGRGRMLAPGLGIMGLGGSNYTPFNTPNEFSEEELAGFLAAGFAEVAGAAEIILVSHPPPFGTKTDKLVDGRHVGSRAVRRFIEEKQPRICLTGHIHESRGTDTIGRTLILNPGMLKHGGYIAVTVENGELAATLHL